MNIIFLSSETPHHYYLINEIHKFHPVKKVFFQTVYAPRKSLLERIKRLGNPGNYGKILQALCSRLLFAGEQKLEDDFEKGYFFSGATPALDPAVPYGKVANFNEPGAVAEVRKEDPDLIIVFGTGILKGEILRLAKLNILNIHRGILPQYRGGGLPTWMYYHNDFENIGTTVHVCSAQLDGGDIVGQKFYRLQKDDKIYKMRGKTTILALEILKEVIDKMKHSGLEYKKQGSAKVWSSKDLTIMKELTARRNFDRYIRSLKGSI